MKAEVVGRMSRVKIRFLSEEECLVLHHAAEEILARTGVLIELEQARDILSAHGAVVKGDRVWIPAGLVKQALSTVPDEFVLYDRSGHPAMYLGGCRTYYGTGSDTAYTSDPLTGAMVPTNYETVARYTRFTDALPNIDFVMSMGIARDRGSASFVAQYAAMVRNTTKPIVFTAQGLRDIETIYEIMKAVHGGEEAVRLYPRAVLYTEPVSPLRHTKKELEMLLFCAERQIPVTVPSGINAGATAPVTLAGALALANAEVLAALVVHQLAKPGAPFMYGGNVTMMDMHTASYPYAAPEFHMGFAALADLGHFYRMPVWGLSGATDSKVVDAQAGAEAAYQLLLAQLSGSNLVHDVGYINSGLTSSMEMLLLCDELISMVRYIAKGIEISDETLALDVIHEIGPTRHFLEHDHTVRHCREAWTPRFFDRRQLELWEQDGGKDLATVLREKAREILAIHKVPELPEGVERKIQEILAPLVP